MHGQRTAAVEDMCKREVALSFHILGVFYAKHLIRVGLGIVMVIYHRVDGIEEVAGGLYIES